MLISFAYIVYSEGFLDKPLQPLPNENVNSKDKLTVYLLCSVCTFVIYILRQLCLFICLFLSVCLLLFLAVSVSPPLYTLPRSCLAIGDNTLSKNSCSCEGSSCPQCAFTDVLPPGCGLCAFASFSEGWKLQLRVGTSLL